MNLLFVVEHFLILSFRFKLKRIESMEYRILCKYKRYDKKILRSRRRKILMIDFTNFHDGWKKKIKFF